MSEKLTSEELRDILSTPTGVTLRFNDPVEFTLGATFAQLPESGVLSVTNAPTTISVLNITRVQLQNTGAVTVTNLLNGQRGQEVKFLGDGFTTFANNTTIKTSTGANKLLATNKVYTFTLFGSTWVENA